MGSLVVVSAAEDNRLTTVDSLKLELSIDGDGEDEYLERLIDRISGSVSTYIGIPAARDGTRSMGVETVSETFEVEAPSGNLALSRWPVIDIFTVDEAGASLAEADYELDGDSGLLRRIRGSYRGNWAMGRTVVSYSAGWTMPGQTGATLPAELEGAAIELVKGARFNRSRDPALRSENILEGLYSYTLFDPTNTKNQMPTAVSAILDRYKRGLSLA